jgi:hypothetical protein
MDLMIEDENSVAGLGQFYRPMASERPFSHTSWSEKEGVAFRIESPMTSAQPRQEEWRWRVIVDLA